MEALLIKYQRQLDEAEKALELSKFMTVKEIAYWNKLKIEARKKINNLS